MLPTKSTRSTSLVLAFGLAVAALSIAAPATARELIAVPGAAIADDIAPGSTIAVSPDPDYPPSDSRYHSYPEILAELDDIAAAHPAIVRVMSLGTTSQGRDIPLVKITDSPGTDEHEPEVLFDSTTHAREHLTPEMALSIIHLLVDGYGTSGYARTTAIVDSRVTWVIPVLNPDGLSWDLGRDPYRGWRKNRQTNGPGHQKGTDINRNYGWHWGGPGSSGDTDSETYRGPGAFSTQEAAAVRDFVQGRAIDGRQRISTHISFHANGELILIPYGYTRADVTPDITTLDQRTFVSMAQAMADTNGYTPKQESDLYVHSGTMVDWMYARQRIFSFTFELYPTDPQPDTAGKFYPPDELIEAETIRNHDAVLYLLEQADCPYRAIGKANAYCGPWYDDLEIGRGWIFDPNGTDTASEGAWQRGDPDGTTAYSTKQPGTAWSGRSALVTGLAAGGCADCNDVDGGITTVRSRTITLPASGPLTLRLRYFLGHKGNASVGDGLRIAVITGGVRTIVLDIPAIPGTNRRASWTAISTDLSAWSGKTVAIQFETTDAGGPSLIEAGVDDLRITSH
ncbi:MAG: M14 family metallopeptidase [Candidatus Limnocylindrales bacterium]